MARRNRRDGDWALGSKQHVSEIDRMAAGAGWGDVMSTRVGSGIRWGELGAEGREKWEETQRGGKTTNGRKKRNTFVG